MAGRALYFANVQQIKNDYHVEIGNDLALIQTTIRFESHKRQRTN